MKKLLTAVFAALLSLSAAAQSTTTTPASPVGNVNTNTAKKRGPVFRATKDQIKQAQTLLKGRGLYNGEATGKLDPDTRAALKKYQEAEGIKVTGTLNRATLEKMSIVLTDRQKTISYAKGEKGEKGKGRKAEKMAPPFSPFPLFPFFLTGCRKSRSPCNRIPAAPAT